jgi:hypothetical protein
MRDFTPRWSCQRQPALGHHLHEVAKAQLEAQVPANAQDDDLAFEVPALEKFFHPLQPLRHPSAFNPRGRQPTAGAICTRSDCMSYLNDENAAMASVHVALG